MTLLLSQNPPLASYHTSNKFSLSTGGYPTLPTLLDPWLSPTSLSPTHPLTYSSTLYSFQAHSHARAFALSFPKQHIYKSYRWTYSPSVSPMAYSCSSFRSLLKCHLLRKTFSDLLSRKVASLSLFILIGHLICLHSICYYLTSHDKLLHVY